MLGADAASPAFIPAEGSLGKRDNPPKKEKGEKSVGVVVSF